MLRSMIRRSCFLMLLMVACFAVAQDEYSADVVQPQRNAKVYVGKDKTRMEPAAAHGREAFITDLTTRTSTVLMFKEHMYLQLPPRKADEDNQHYFYRTGDAENACADFLAQEWCEGETCHKVGSETVKGRATVKYEWTNAKGESGTMWIDRKLRIRVKWQRKDLEGELQNIQEGAQPASLFEIPAGYTKFDEGGLLKQKQNQ